MDRSRITLLYGIVGLAALQIVHSLDVFRYSDDATLSGLFLAPDAIVGIGSCVIASALLLWRRPSARLWTLGASVIVTLGFVQHHLLPTYSGAANPYWTFDEGFRGDFIRWITVLAIVAVGIWTAWTAWQARAVRAVAVPTGFEPVSPP